MMKAVGIFMLASAAVTTVQGQAEEIVSVEDKAYFTIERRTEGGRTVFREASSYGEERTLEVKEKLLCNPENSGTCQFRVVFYPRDLSRVPIPSGGVQNIPYGYASVTESNPYHAEINMDLYSNTPVHIGEVLTEHQAYDRNPVRFVPTSRGQAQANAEALVYDAAGQPVGLQVKASAYFIHLCAGCGDEVRCTQCPASTTRFYLLMSAILKPPTSGKLDLINSFGNAGNTVRLQVQTYDNRPAASLRPTRVSHVVSLPSGTWAALHFQPKSGLADVTGYSRLVVEVQCKTNVVVEINVGRDEEGGMWNAAKQSCGPQRTTINVPLPNPKPQWMKQVKTLAWALFAPYNNGGYIQNTEATFYHSYFE